MTSVIYFVQRSNGDVKIGTTSQPVRRRVKNLVYEHGPLTLLGIVDGGQVKEKLLHWCLAGMQLDGEWFTLTEEIQSIIDKYADGPVVHIKKYELPDYAISASQIDINKYLSIKEIQQITGWDWRRCNRFAKKHGRLVQGETPRGKWYVPRDAMASYIINQKAIVHSMDENFQPFMSNGHAT